MQKQQIYAILNQNYTTTQATSTIAQYSQSQNITANYNYTNTLPNNKISKYIIPKNTISQ